MLIFVVYPGDLLTKLNDKALYLFLVYAGFSGAARPSRPPLMARVLWTSPHPRRLRPNHPVRPNWVPLWQANGLAHLWLLRQTVAALHSHGAERTTGSGACCHVPPWSNPYPEFLPGLGFCRIPEYCPVLGQQAHACGSIPQEIST